MENLATLIPLVFIFGMSVRLVWLRVVMRQPQVEPIRDE